MKPETAQIAGPGAAAPADGAPIPARHRLDAGRARPGRRAGVAVAHRASGNPRSRARRAGERLPGGFRTGAQRRGIRRRQRKPLPNQASLDRLRQAYPQFDVFYLVDDPPASSCRSHRRTTATWPGKCPTRLSSSCPQKGKVAYTEPFTSPKTGRLAVDLVLPRADGSLMVGELSLNALQAAVDNRLKTGGQPASALITSSDGTLSGCLRPANGRGAQPTPARLAPAGACAVQPGNATYQIRVNLRAPQPILLSGLTTVGQTGWLVSVETSVLASLSIFVIGGAASFLLVVALTVFLIVGFGKRLRKSVVHPLALLNERTTQLAQGDFSRWVSFETVSASSLEVAELASNFQKMQVAIQQRQAALKTSEMRFREMTELLPDMVFELDLQRSIKYANRATSLALGYSYPEFEQGINFDQLLTQDEVQNLKQACTLTAEGYLPQPVVYRFKRKDGETFPGEFALSAVRDRDGFVTGFRGVARDITERLSFEEALRRSYQLFTEGPVVVFRVQASGSSPVEYVTPNVAQFGYKPHDFTSREDFFSQIIHPNDAERVSSEAQRQLDAGALYYEQEYRILCANGETRWVYDFTSVNRNNAGKPTHIDWYMLDITERKQAEVRIKTQLQRLAALQMIDASITANADIRFTLQILVTQLLSLLKVDAAIILRYNPISQRLEYAAGDGFRIELPTSISLKLGESYAGRAAQVRERVQVSAAPEVLAKEFKTPGLLKEEFVSYYGLPLIAKSEVKGVLEVFHRSRLDPDQEWMDFLENLAGQAAIAISSADLLENLHRSYEELKRANYATIEGFSRAMEIRDRETEGHSHRVSDLTARLAARVGVARSRPGVHPHRRAAARFRQGGHTGRHPAQRGQADRGGMAGDAPPSGRRRPHLLGHRLPAARHGHPQVPPREVGRQRLPLRVEGQANPAGGAHFRRGGRVGRAELSPLLPPGLAAGKGAALSARAGGQALRPSAGGTLPGHPAKGGRVPDAPRAQVGNCLTPDWHPGKINPLKPCRGSSVGRARD